ncbi:MAG TPA: uroporphyrinogen decarboxylase family protein [Acidobacteriota bacterium]|nr:uroporphyrinogen decarboxylase family protein [Acidobacteriota bacterium]
MNSRERVAAAMRMEAPDRVPVMCQLSLGHYFLNCDIPEIEIWHTTEGFGEALIQLQQRYRFDGVLINLPGRDPNWRSHVRRVENRGGDTVIHWRNGWFTVCPPDDNPHVFREDGQRYVIPFERINPRDLLYVEPHDLIGLTYPLSWDFTGSAATRDTIFPPWQFNTIDYVRARVGANVSIHGEIFSPFTQLFELVDHQNALLALVDDPEKCEECLEALTQGTILLGRGQAEHGVDAILISSAFAGAGFISPGHYRRFVLPFEQKVIRGIKEFHDIPVYTHTCGRIGDRLELMRETGTDGIDTLDPPPLGNVELADAKDRIGRRLFIKGNLDPVNVMLKETRNQVRAAAMSCLEAGAKGGGYVLSTACSVPPHAPPENLEVLVETAERFEIG